MRPPSCDGGSLADEPAPARRPHDPTEHRATRWRATASTTGESGARGEAGGAAAAESRRRFGPRRRQNIKGGLQLGPRRAGAHHGDGRAAASVEPLSKSVPRRAAAAADLRASPSLLPSAGDPLCRSRRPDPVFSNSTMTTTHATLPQPNTAAAAASTHRPDRRSAQQQRHLAAAACDHEPVGDRQRGGQGICARHHPRHLER